MSRAREMLRWVPGLAALTLCTALHAQTVVLRSTVVDEGSEPIARSQTRAHSLSGWHSSASHLRDSSEHFLLPGEQWIVAFAPGYRMAEDFVRIAADDEALERTFTLARAPVTDVCVVSSSGAPLDDVFRASGCEIQASVEPVPTSPRPPDSYVANDRVQPLIPFGGSYDSPLLLDRGAARGPLDVPAEWLPASPPNGENGRVARLFFQALVPAYVLLVRGPSIVATATAMPGDEELVFVCDEADLAVATGTLEVRAVDPDGVEDLRIQRAWIDADLAAIEPAVDLSDLSVVRFRDIELGQHVLTLECIGRPLVRTVVRVEGANETQVPVPKGRAIEICPVLGDGKPYPTGSFVELLPADEEARRGRTVTGYLTRRKGGRSLHTFVGEDPLLARATSHNARSDWLRIDPTSRDRICITMKPVTYAVLIPRPSEVGFAFDVRGAEGIVASSRFVQLLPCKVPLAYGSYELVVHGVDGDRQQGFEVSDEQVRVPPPDFDEW